ncbi:R3H domain-containing protein 1-like [Sinocyclocheilus grahami]|uniref:R3H domain-containing protein 1-like n=1 Tax=Sinocyclocheilus grahami TaxID=75366 RepID=UPI0007ACD450|nr:PREDICTED: R3H domain-containing protein 1-like [Sinocyclocheilus grahami]
MMLVQQASGDVYPLQSPAPPPHQSGYVMSSTGPTFPTASVSQQQMPACYCSPSQFPVSGQLYQPMGSVPYSAPSQIPPAPAQQPGYQTVMPNQQQSYQNMIRCTPPQNPMQGMMVQYPSEPSYQVSVPQQTYQQPVYYSIFPPHQQSAGSSSVGFLPPPRAEQMPLHRTTAPCGSKQIRTQQCSGAPPPAAGGMVMMHLTLPASQQPQSHSPPQWKHNQYYSSDHTHSQKPSDVCGLEPSRSSPQLGSSSSTHLTNVKSIRPSLNTVPIMPHFSRSMVSGQGDLRFQYSPQIRPPLLQAPPTLSSQTPAGIRKLPRKALSTDLSVGDAGNPNSVPPDPAELRSSRSSRSSESAELVKLGAKLCRNVDQSCPVLLSKHTPDDDDDDDPASSSSSGARTGESQFVVSHACIAALALLGLSSPFLCVPPPVTWQKKDPPPAGALLELELLELLEGMMKDSFIFMWRPGNVTWQKKDPPPAGALLELELLELLELLEGMMKDSFIFMWRPGNGVNLCRRD